MNVRVREFPGFRNAVKAEPTDADLQAIYQATGRRVEPSDIHVRRAQVAHNQHDRTLERFPKAYLERFAETLPGKSLLPGHDTSALPLGRWFQAETHTRGMEFPCLVNPVKSETAPAEKAAEIVPGFAPQNKRVTWLDAGFYFAQDPSTEGMRKSIDTGVYDDVSIGFKYDDIDCDVCRKSYLGDCPHYRGQRLEDARLVTLTYSGDPQQAEARETSLVYLGAQQEAALMKSLREGNVDPQAYAATPLGEDLVRLKFAEVLARKFGHQRKSWAFPGLKASLPVGGEEKPPVGGQSDDPAADAANGDKSMDLKKLKALLGLPDDTADAEVLLAAEKRFGDLKTALDAAKVKEVADLQALATAGTSALEDLQKAILDDDLRLTGKESAEVKEIVEMHVGRRNYARLKALRDEKRAAVLAKFPTEPSGDVNAGQRDDKTPAAPPVGPGVLGRDYAIF